MKTFLTVAAACIVSVPAIALACGDAPQQVQASAAPMCDSEHMTAEVKTITVPELASLNVAKKVTVFDANGSQTRTKMGVIPGAKLLTSSTQYAAAELPANHESALVFYCANTRCMASHEAAERATTFGYKNVSVLPVGIKGWVDAGQHTDKISTPRS